MKIFNLNTIVKIAVLSALAYCLMLLNFSIPIFPSFLKFDFSEIPVIIATFSMGSIAGVCVELVKNLLHLPISSTMFAGELANFIIGSSYALIAGLYYKYHKTKNGAFTSVILGLITAVIFSCIANYAITLPAYHLFFGMSTDTIVAMSQKAAPFIQNKLTLILYGFLPFNILKNVVVSTVTMLIYKPISPLLHRTYIN